jgi:branched-chain amino acid transport system ATP-binding protein
MSFFSVDNLSINFGGIKAVDGVSFDVGKGEVFTIIGPNGAGKTTIFNLVSRIYQPTGGKLVFDGTDITNVAPHRIAALGIARTFQNIELFEHATLLQNLLLARHAHKKSNFVSELLFLPSVRAMELEHREAVEKAIDFLDLQQYRDSFIVNLPYGVRKVTELARALCTDPKLLLLDEPSAGLAPVVVQQVFELVRRIRAGGLTVLIVEQNVQQVLKVVDRAYLLEAGTIRATGSAQEMLASDLVKQAYLGV